MLHCKKTIQKVLTVRPEGCTTGKIVNILFILVNLVASRFYEWNFPAALSLVVFYNQTSRFESLDEILKCDHSNKRSSATLFHNYVILYTNTM